MTTFDKEAQRKRAAEFAVQAAAKAGVVLPHFTNTSNPIDFPKPVQQITSAPVPATATKIVKAKRTPKPKKVTYDVVPFTNNFGQVCYPGQKVIAVSAGYNHTTKIAIGVYLGLRTAVPAKVRSVVVRVTRKKSHWVNAAGEKCSFRDHGAKYVQKDVECQTSLPSRRIYPTV